jgi:hypothetical protein
VTVVCFCRVVHGGNETVSGSVEITIPAGKKMEHLGIKIEMIGQIELYFDKTNNMKFTTLVRELESAGTMMSSKVGACLSVFPPLSSSVHAFVTVLSPFCPCV